MEIRDPAVAAAHAARVAAICRAVKERDPTSLVRADHGASHTPYAGRSAGYQGSSYTSVGTSALNNILSIDRDRLVAVCEAGVTMRALVDALLLVPPSSTTTTTTTTTAHPLLLPALPAEGENFTVGGLLSGFGIQATSHRVGLFHDTVLEAEVVLGDGRVVVASPTFAPDLFALLPGSLGTLGIVTAVSIRLMRAHPHVRVSVSAFSTADMFAEGLVAALSRGVDSAPFVEGFAFSRESFAVVEARFEEEAGVEEVEEQGGSAEGTMRLGLRPPVLPDGPPDRVPHLAPLYDPTVRGSPFYYQRVREEACRSSPSSSSSFRMHTRSFVFRQTRGLWWLLEHYLGLPVVTGTAWGRGLLDDAEAAKSKGATAQGQGAKVDAATARGWQPRPGSSFSHSDYARCLPTQGFYVGAAKLPPFLRLVDEQMGIFPLWVCPVRVLEVATLPRQPQQQPQQQPLTSRGRLWARMTADDASASPWCFDVGVYGCPSSPRYRAAASLARLRALADSPTQWGLVSMPEAEARRPVEEGGVLDVRAYARVRKAYAAEGAFPDVFAKARAGGGGGGGGGGGPGDGDRGVDWCWRLKRDGVFGQCVACWVALVGVAVVWGVGLWGAAGGRE